jgi:copper chaperone CopZ
MFRLFHKPGPALSLEVEGIRCAHCESTIKIAVSKILGVRSVSICRNRHVEIKTAPGQPVSRAEVVAVLEEQGYRLVETT